MGIASIEDGEIVLSAIDSFSECFVGVFVDGCGVREECIEGFHEGCGIQSLPKLDEYGCLEGTLK